MVGGRFRSALLSASRFPERLERIDGEGFKRVRSPQHQHHHDALPSPYPLRLRRERRNRQRTERTHAESALQVSEARGRSPQRRN